MMFPIFSLEKMRPMLGVLALLILLQGEERLSADEATPDFESLTTVHGRSYESIFILDSDDSGLLFRHREGIAKLNYTELSANLRDLFEPLPDEVTASGEILSPTEELQEGAVSFVEKESTSSHEPARVYFIERQVVNYVPFCPVPSPFPFAPSYPVHFQPNPNSLYNAIYRPHLLRPNYWPAHRSRYHSAHALAQPWHRAAAVQDFLYTSGLVPLPPGVNVVSLPTSTPWNFR